MASSSLVALHGFTGSGRDFAPLWASLGRTGWAPDLPGHGSASEERPTLAELLDDLEARRRAAAAGPWVLIGYSMGGRLALHLALRHPAELRALVLIGASPGLATEEERVARRASDGALAQHVRTIGGPRFAGEWALHPLIASQRRMPEPWAAEQAQRRLDNDPSGLAWSLEHCGQGALPSLWAALPMLSVPTLLLHGVEDQKFGALHSQMAAQMPDATSLEVPEAGHAVHLEQPQRTAALLQQFLDQNDA
jgi:2-succinyl-6-hydroxy-2,4-cyclohexadiene-1-carboxylate synthase